MLGCLRILIRPPMRNTRCEHGVTDETETGVVANSNVAEGSSRAIVWIDRPRHLTEAGVLFANEDVTDEAPAPREARVDPADRMASHSPHLDPSTRISYYADLLLY